MSYTVADVGNAQEIVFTTAGQLGEAEVGGPSMNLVPRQGGNRFTGTFFANGAPITLTYTSSSPGAPVVTHTVSTDSTGAFTDQNASPEGTETVDARYAGNGVYGPAEQTCTFPVQPFIP